MQIRTALRALLIPFLVASGPVGGAHAMPGDSDRPALSPAQSPAQSPGWSANASDHLAGISDLKKVSKPAVVDYDQLYEATEEIKKMRKEKIDPDSAKGRSLRQQAAERVTKAANAIRKEKRHCSVWKAISHKDGRAVDDITSEVEAKLSQV